MIAAEPGGKQSSGTTQCGKLATPADYTAPRAFTTLHSSTSLHVHHL